MWACQATVCGRYSPGSRPEIMSRMRTNSRGLPGASCTLAKYTSLRNLRGSAAARSIVYSRQTMWLLSRPLLRLRWNPPGSPAPSGQGVADCVDPQAVPRVEHDPARVRRSWEGRGADRGGGQGLALAGGDRFPHVAPAAIRTWTTRAISPVTPPPSSPPCYGLLGTRNRSARSAICRSRRRCIRFRQPPTRVVASANG